MEGPNPNKIFQKEGELAKNTKQINLQVTVPEASNKSQMNYITIFLIQD